MARQQRQGSDFGRVPGITGRLSDGNPFGDLSDDDLVETGAALETVLADLTVGWRDVATEVDAEWPKNAQVGHQAWCEHHPRIGRGRRGSCDIRSIVVTYSCERGHDCMGWCGLRP